MSKITYRRIRRRSTHDVTQAGKEHGPEQPFFGATPKNAFFQPSPVVQRKCEKCKEEENKLQRTQEKEEDKLQKKDAGNVAGVSPGVSNYVQSLNGNGHALPVEANQFFSEKMDYDFSNVKIHTGKEAAQSAKEVNAKAYTLGEHIVFNDGQYNTKSTEGKKLMAHELAHVIQNRPESDSETVRRQTSAPIPPAAIIDPNTHIATFAINGVNVVVEPDQTLTRGTSVTFHRQRYAVNRSGALTVSYLRPRLIPSYTGTGRRKRVSSVSLSFTLYIKTYFGTRASSADTSAYGRGTTVDDIAAGNTSLGFHEGRHGQDYQDYIAQNPLPQITLAVPASIRDYNAAVKQFNREMRAYSASMGVYSHTNTDMVGTPGP